LQGKFPAVNSSPIPRAGAILTVGVVSVVVIAGIGVAFLAALLGEGSSTIACAAKIGGRSGVILDPAGAGRTVGASEYGGPGDPSSGTIGSSGVNLLQNPDSYAELGGYSFKTAIAMGGLPYGTPLRITYGGHSAIAYKRDIGLGGGPVDGHPRVIDLWWQFATGLGIPYEHGEWSGAVRVERTPDTGASNLLGEDAATTGGSARATGDQMANSCAPEARAPLTLTSGQRATLLGDGLATAPAGAPEAVRAMIAAGNQLVGKPYLYGGGHGLPLNEIAPAYDCSSSVDHILYGAGLVSVTDDSTSGALESFGQPGPGRWVTLYASPDHVFLYVAGLRWDTHNAAGPGDGSTGIGWHPLVRGAAGFVARHPVGL
jgi:cell wall-associated NlpC family hydrolase